MTAPSLNIDVTLPHEMDLDADGQEFFSGHDELAYLISLEPTEPWFGCREAIPATQPANGTVSCKGIAVSHLFPEPFCLNYPWGMHEASTLGWDVSTAGALF